MDTTNIIEVIGTVAKDIPLPIIPLYDMKFAAQLIPCKHHTLSSWLSLHREKVGKPVYRREGTGRKVRLLTAKDIETVRATMIKGPGLESVLGIYPDMTNGHSSTP